MATITVKAGGGGDYTTIQAACDACSAGDTIEVYTGTYNEHVDVDTVDGTSGAGRITLKAAAGNTVTMSPAAGTYIWSLAGKDYWTFDFTGFVFTPTGLNSLFTYTSPGGNVCTDPIIKNITCTSTNIYYMLTAVTSGVHVDNLLIQDCVQKNGQRGMIQLGSGGQFDGTIIERCYCYNSPTNRQIFIIPTAGGANYTVTIRNCIAAKGGSGIYDFNNTQDYTLNAYNNTIYDMAADGIYLGSGTRASTYNIKNNIISDCDDYGLDDPNTDATYNLDYNCWNNNTTGDTRNEAIGAHAQEGDPGMVDPGNEDYTLDGVGLATDTGVDLSGSFTDDYAGTTRSVLWDIGAYDYATAAAASPKHGFVNFQDPGIV